MPSTSGTGYISGLCYSTTVTKVPQVLRKKVSGIAFFKLPLTGTNAELKNSFKQESDYRYGRQAIISNSCKGNKLVELPEQYDTVQPNSITGEQGICPITNFMELRDIDLIALRT